MDRGLRHNPGEPCRPELTNNRGRLDRRGGPAVTGYISRKHAGQSDQDSMEDISARHGSPKGQRYALQWLRKVTVLSDNISNILYRLYIILQKAFPDMYCRLYCFREVFIRFNRSFLNIMENVEVGLIEKKKSFPHPFIYVLRNVGIGTFPELSSAK